MVVLRTGENAIPPVVAVGRADLVVAAGDEGVQKLVVIRRALRARAQIRGQLRLRADPGVEALRDEAPAVVDAVVSPLLLDEGDRHGRGGPDGSSEDQRTEDHRDRGNFNLQGDRRRA